MDKKIFITTAITLVIALIGLLCYNYFEIYEYKEPVYPAREVSNNSYYAAENWLKETGHQVRIVNELYTPQLAEINEKVIVIHSRTLHINDPKEIKQWIADGGFFVLAVEQYSSNLNADITDFLLDYGISSEYTDNAVIIRDTDEKKDEENEIIAEDETEIFSFPDFQNRITFIVENDEEFFSISDSAGNIKLAEFLIGDGALTIIGMPVFMNNYHIKKEANAVLTWSLTGGRFSEEIPSEEKGILFVRSSNRNASNSLIETIMERGNLIPVIISAFLLIFLGFWMVIPGFGLVPEEKQRMSRPLKDRFTAEIRFLKKNHALNYYLKAFERGQDSEKEEIYNYKELINQYRRLINGKTKI